MKYNKTSDNLNNRKQPDNLEIQFLSYNSLIFVRIKEAHFCLDSSFSKLIQETLL